MNTWFNLWGQLQNNYQSSILRSDSSNWKGSFDNGSDIAEIEGYTEESWGPQIKYHEKNGYQNTTERPESAAADERQSNRGDGKVEILNKKKKKKKKMN